MKSSLFNILDMQLVLLSLLVCVLLNSGFVAGGSISFDKASYVIGDTVNMKIVSSESDVMEIVSPAKSFRLVGNPDGQHKFNPEDEGAHVVSLINSSSGREVVSAEFMVLGQDLLLRDAGNDQEVARDAMMTIDENIIKGLGCDKQSYLLGEIVTIRADFSVKYSDLKIVTPDDTFSYIGDLKPEIFFVPVSAGLHIILVVAEDGTPASINFTVIEPERKDMENGFLPYQDMQIMQLGTSDMDSPGNDRKNIEGSMLLNRNYEFNVTLDPLAGANSVSVKDSKGKQTLVKLVFKKKAVENLSELNLSDNIPKYYLDSLNLKELGSDNLVQQEHSADFYLNGSSNTNNANNTNNTNNKNNKNNSINGSFNDAEKSDDAKNSSNKSSENFFSEFNFEFSFENSSNESGNAMPHPGQGMIENKENIVQNSVIHGEFYDIDVMLDDGAIEKIAMFDTFYDGVIDIRYEKLNYSDFHISGSAGMKAFALNLENVNFSSGLVTSVAVGNTLWKCIDWNFTSQSCFGEWNKLMEIVPGSEYNIQIYPGDPGYVETFDSNESMDVALTVLDNTTFVIGWVDRDSKYVSFEIWSANGTRIVDQTDVDTSGDDGSRVALSTINFSNFLVSTVDGPANDALFFIYNRTGSAVQAATTVDSEIGDNNDVDVCQLGDLFVVAYANGDPTDLDADFQIWNNSGNIIVTETNVDASMTPERPNQNLVSCAPLNSSYWGYAWYDAGTSDDVSLAIRNQAGTSIVSADIDTSVGNNAHVDVAGLKNKRLAYVFYDAADSDITITVRQYTTSLTSILANTDIDTNAGNDSRVAVAAIDNVSSSNFVVAWIDRNDTTIKAAVYNETGVQIRAPFNITTTPNLNSMGLDVASYNSNLNFGLCDGTGNVFIIAYTNATAGAVYETYYINGTRWYGECPDIVAPNVSLSYPPNETVINSSSVMLNFSVTDNVYYVMKNCTLWTNITGAFARNQTIFDIQSSQQINFSLTLNDSSYLWNVQCFDNSSNSAFSAYNLTFKVNGFPPNITMLSLNSTLINQSEYIKFNASITDHYNISFAYATLQYPDSSQANITLANSGTEYYFEFNDTVQIGAYSIIYVWANDTLNQENYNASPGISFIVTSSPPTQFSLVSPLNGTSSKILNPNMTWQQSTDSHFANYTLILDKNSGFYSPDFEYSNPEITNTSRVLDFVLDANEIYYWRVIAYDIFGNSRNSAQDFMYITDTQGPTINLNTPENNSFVVGSSASFNFTPSETNNLSHCVLYGNFSGAFQPNETLFNPLNGVPNYAGINLAQGIYVWNFLCNDTAGNSRFAQGNYTFSVDTQPPAINLFSPENNSIENESNIILFEANASDVIADVSSCTLVIDSEAIQTVYIVVENQNFNFTSFVQNGNHSWRVNCTDSNGLTGYSNLFNISVLVVDNDPPFITLNYPSQGLFLSSNNVTFNYTAEDSTGIRNCSLYLDGLFNRTDYFIENLAYNYFSVDMIPEGGHNWSVQCIDNSSSNNTQFSEAYDFEIDITPPYVELQSPLNNSYSGSLVDFSYYINESNLAGCALFGNFSGFWSEDQFNSSASSGQQNNFAKLLSDGTYFWNVKCNETSGLYRYADSNFTINVDTSPPHFSDISSFPSSPVNYSEAGNHHFNVSWSDQYILDAVIFESNFSGALVNITVNSSSNIFGINISGASAGNYYYRWYANDSRNNLNFTEPYVYEILKLGAIVSLSLNGTEENISINEDTQIAIEASLTNPASGYLELYMDGVLINSGTSPLENNTLFPDPGIFNITLVYPDSDNYSMREISYFVFVNDTTPPVVMQIAPLNNSEVAAGTISLQFNVSDKSFIPNCSLFVDESYNATLENVSVEVPVAFSVSFQEGAYSWFVVCFDNASNSAATWTSFFTAINSSVIKAHTQLKNQSVEYADNAYLRLNTTDYFNNSLLTNVTLDIVLGNTTLPWWNISFMYRKPILLSNQFNVTKWEGIKVNISGFNGTISNCSKEIRIVENISLNQTSVPFTFLRGDNNDSCEIFFNANVSAGSVNLSRYWIYYSNPSAELPSESIGAAGLKVQRGAISATGTTITVNIPSTNRSRAFVLFNANTASSSPTLNQLTSDMPLDTQIQFLKYVGTTASNVSWQIVEGSDLYVQRGSGDIAAGSPTINFSINNVNLSSSFILVNGRANSGTAGNSNNGMFTARFINSTAISIQRGTTAIAGAVSYQVVEWKGAKVQSGNLTFTTAGANIDINETDLSRSFVVVSRYISGDTGPDSMYVYANYSNSSRIVASRFTAIGTAGVSWFSVELPPGFKVQRGAISVTTDTNSAVETVEMNKTFNMESWSNSNTGTTFVNALMAVTLTNRTNLLFDKQSATNTNAVAWFLIEALQPNYTAAPGQKFIARNTTETDSFGYFEWVWPTRNQNLGNYSFVAYAQKQDFIPVAASSPFEIVNDMTKPNVTLILPEDNYISGSGYFNFSYLPFDTNLNNCTLYINPGGLFGPNVSNSSPFNNGTNNFTEVYLGVWLYSWNVLCFDTFNNSAFAAFNFTLNITGSDLVILPQNIWFSEVQKLESVNVTVFANVSNEGLSIANESFKVQFFRGDPASGGTQLNGDFFVDNLSIGEFLTFNVSFSLSYGPNNIFVRVDSDNTNNESDESNNKANKSIDVELYQYFYGDVNRNIILGDNENISFINFMNISDPSGNVYFADIDSSFQFTDLRALGRTSGGIAVANDFSDLDVSMNTSSFNDSIKNVWGAGTDNPLMVESFNISDFILDNVPVAISTNSLTFRTGILWDSADDLSLNQQYDSSDKEDVVFVTKINSSQTGSYGTYDYEVKIPATLRDYRTGETKVVFYTEIY